MASAAERAFDVGDEACSGCVGGADEVLVMGTKTGDGASTGGGKLPAFPVAGSEAVGSSTGGVGKLAVGSDVEVPRELGAFACWAGAVGVDEGALPNQVGRLALAAGIVEGGAGEDGRELGNSSAADAKTTDDEGSASGGIRNGLSESSSLSAAYSGRPSLLARTMGLLRLA